MIIVSIYVIYRYLCLNLLFPEGSMVFGTKMPIKSPDDCDITLTALQLVFLLQLHTLLTTDFQIDFQILPVHRKFGKVFVGFQPLCFPCVWVCPKIYVPHECPTKMDHFFRAFWGGCIMFVQWKGLFTSPPPGCRACKRKPQIPPVAMGSGRSKKGS